MKLRQKNKLTPYIMAEEATKEEGAEEASDNTESKKSADSNKKK